MAQEVEAVCANNADQSQRVDLPEHLGNLNHPSIQSEFPWLASAVDRLQIPQRWLPEILPLLTEAPRRVAKASLGKMIGVPWYAMPEYLSSLEDAPESSIVLPLFEDPIYSKVLQLRPEAEGQVLEGFPSANEHARLFSADFRCAPYPLERYLFGTDWTAHYFAAFLPDPHQSVASQIAKGLAHKHVHGALCYLRFYIENDTVLITEVQSDEWKHIDNRFFRQEVYQDWPRVLMNSFEAFLSACYPERRLTLALADPEYIKQRWRIWDTADTDPEVSAAFKGIADSVADFFYQDLPSRLAYTRSDTPLQTRESNLREKDLTIQNPWIKVVEPGEGPASSAITPYTMLVPSEAELLGQEFAAAQEEFASLPGAKTVNMANGYGVILRVNGHAPRTKEEEQEGLFELLQITKYKPGCGCSSDLNHLEQGGAALMGESREMLPHEEYPVFPELRELHADILARSPEASRLSCDVLVDKTQSPVFRLPPLGVRSLGQHLRSGAYGSMGSAFSMVTTPQEFEPALVGLIPTDGGVAPFSINFFGGGTLSLDEMASARMKEILECSPALVASKTQHAGRVLLYGVSKEAVVERFVSLLGFHELSAMAKHLLDRTLPVPYCAMNFLGLPLVRSEDNLNFRFSFAQDPLGQLRTVSRTNLRLSTFVMQLLLLGHFEAVMPGDEAKEYVDDMLEFLYWMNCEDFIKPSGTPVLPDGKVTIASTFGYLGEVYNANSEAADRICSRIADELLAFTGIVHRFGGLLSADPFSAQARKKRPSEIDFRNDMFFNWASPSELSLRSVDITGSFHHASYASHQPWIGLTQRGEERI